MTRLYNRGQVNSFSLAEMQVWSGGENIALGKPVTALDRFNDPQFPRWQPEFLVDGFNSKNRIINDAEWIAGLTRRGEIVRELAALEHQRATASDAALVWVAKTSASVVGGVLLIAGALLWRARTARKRAVEKLRRRIASDLHDEIGSNLAASRCSPRPRGGKVAMRKRPRILPPSKASRHARTRSLREIVWFIIQRGDSR